MNYPDDDTKNRKLVSHSIVYMILLVGCLYYLHLPEKYANILKVLYLISIIPLIVIIFIPNKSNLTWIKRILIYFIVMVISLFVSNAILSTFELFLNTTMGNTNIDNSRYMLSALIQSEAAIVAIVVTLTLVAVQQTSSSYSTRLIDIFKNRNPDFWILLIIYIGAIIYQLSILTNLNDNAISDGHIFFAYFLGLFSFIALIPYMLNTIDLLKPLTMMMFLSEKITKNNILSIETKDFDFFSGLYNRSSNNIFLNTEDLNVNNKDPVLPIIDIVNSSLMKHDYDTSRDGLLVLRKISFDILKNNDIKDEEFKKIFNLFSKHFLNTGKLAIHKSDDECVILVLNWFYEIMMIFIEMQKDSEASLALGRIGEIGKIAAEQRNMRMTVVSIRHFQAIIDTSSEINMKYLQRTVAHSLNDIGEISAQYKIRGVYHDILQPLSTIIYRDFVGTYMEEEYEEYSEEEFEEYVEEDTLLDEYFKELDKMPNDLVMLTLRGICRIGQVLYEKNMTDDLEYITTFIKVIINQAPKYGREDALNLASDFLSSSIKWK